MKDAILQTIFGGGRLDWNMLEKCEYDFNDIWEIVKQYNIIDMRKNYKHFNSIVESIMELYKQHIQDKLDEKITETESDLKELERYSDENNNNIDQKYIDEISNLRKQLEELQTLCVDDDISYYANYLDSGIYILNDEIRALYKKYLAQEIKKENELIGFVSLDLD